MRRLIKLGLPVILVLGLLPCECKSAANDEKIRKSVVKIFTTFQKPNYYQPWQMNPQDSLSGSGCIIKGDRILTNAHVVSDSNYIQVRKAGEADKYTAEVEYVAHDCELAVLKVEDPSFFKGTVPIELGELPHQRDKVAAYGFPAGGDELSVTEGVVSRIEVTDYAHSEMQLLTIQTDAAINPGNSGGPVIKDGKLIGVSFQSYSGSGVENIGYIVPEVLIRRFFKDIEDKTYDGIPKLGIIWQKMESKALRKFYGMKAGDTGILVNKVIYGASGHGRLKEGDVITSIDKVRVSNYGTIPFRKNERMLFNHLISLSQTGQTVKINVLRDSKPMTLTVKLKKFKPLVKEWAYDSRPAYYIYAGFVFTPLSRNYVNLWEWTSAPEGFMSSLEFGFPSREKSEIILISHVLPDDVNIGYHDVVSPLVEKVNGIRISGMKDLIKAFEKPPGKYHVIELDTKTSFDKRIVIEADAAANASAKILSRYGIKSDRSENLK